jgi:hypothetical protein
MFDPWVPAFARMTDARPFLISVMLTEAGIHL